MRQYRPVEPLLLHPLVRPKDTLDLDPRRHNHSNPYVLSQFQPYYGSGPYPIIGNGSECWDDTHYRWPSPSLPPTLKKDRQSKQNNFGTLDKGDLIRHSISPEKMSNGRINYGFSRGSPDGDFEIAKHSSDKFSTSSTSNDSDDMTIDDFGDVVKRRKSSSQGSKKSGSGGAGNKSRTIVRQSTDEEEDDEDGWTTEF